MGWGTFIAGRILSSQRRGLSPADIERVEAESVRAEEDDKEQREKFVHFAVEESALGHPEIRKIVNLSEWIELIEKKSFYFFNTFASIFYAFVAFLLLLPLIFIFNLDEDDDWSITKTAWVATSSIIIWGFTYFRIRNYYVKRVYAFWINRNFRKQGWDIRKLSKELWLEKNPDYASLQGKPLRTVRTTWWDFKKEILQTMADSEKKQAAKKENKARLFPNKRSK